MSILDQKLTNVADAIRYKTGVSGLLSFYEMTAAINCIQQGSGKKIVDIKCVTRASNGLFLGDGDGDGKISQNDLAPLAGLIGLINETNAHADIDGDGEVTTADLVIFARLAEEIEQDQVIGRIEITYDDNTMDKFYCLLYITPRVYTVHFMSEDGSTQYGVETVSGGGDATCSGINPTKTETPQYTYACDGWSLEIGGNADPNALKNITSDIYLYAHFTPTLRTYTVRFYVETQLFETVENVPYGGSASCAGATPISSFGSLDDYPFEGWNPLPQNISGDTNCYAQFGAIMEDVEIEDGWDQIVAAVNNGTATTKYKNGNYKTLTLTNGTSYIMQIVGKGVDALADDSGYATLTWIAKAWKGYGTMMPASGYNGYITGGWGESAKRQEYEDITKPMIPTVVVNAIKTVYKKQPIYSKTDKKSTQTTKDALWMPSYDEMASDYGSEHQPRYYAVYPDANSRKHSTRTIWLRSAADCTRYDTIKTNGSTSTLEHNNGTPGYTFGFCM